MEWKRSMALVSNSFSYLTMLGFRVDPVWDKSGFAVSKKTEQGLSAEEPSRRLINYPP